MRRVVIFLASAGYIGYIPFASGTWGTAPRHSPVLAARRRHRLAGSSPSSSTPSSPHRLLDRRATPRRTSQSMTASKIVIDEIVGYLAATLFMLVTRKTILIAFFIFRAFDVTKPFPAGYIDAGFPGGPGVVLDDVVSGIYSNVVTRLLLLLLSLF